MSRMAAFALAGSCALLGLLGQGLSAGAEPNVFAPESVLQDSDFEMTVTNCKPGSDYKAYIEWTQTFPDGTTATTESREAEGDGETQLPRPPERLSLSQVGTHTFDFYCRHAGKGTWWGPERITIQVIPNLGPAGGEHQVELKPTRINLPPADFGDFKKVEKVLISVTEPTGTGPEGDTLWPTVYVYEVTGPNPLGKKEGRLQADPDGTSTITFKIKPSHKQGKYLVEVTALGVHENVETILWEDRGKFKLVD